jgi:hypothetical protein
MALRKVLVGLIVVATAAFVVGTTIERNSSGESGHHDEAAKAAPTTGEARASGEAHSKPAESPAAHAEESAGGRPTVTAEKGHAELRPLGIDMEAWPFVALAAVVSLGLGAAALLRPAAAPLLVLVAVAMLAFAVLDVREVVHQLDIDKSGLAVLAGAIAALRAAAAVVAATMASRAWRPGTGPPGTAGTMPA